MLDLWYKNAIIYCLDVETFMDSNADGVGDFRGLTDRLDHLKALGATALWLNPFYPTPNRDNGYDITDFYGVEPRLGSPGDFVVARPLYRVHNSAYGAVFFGPALATSPTYRTSISRSTARSSRPGPL